MKRFFVNNITNEDKSCYQVRVMTKIAPVICSSDSSSGGNVNANYQSSPQSLSTVPEEQDKMTTTSTRTNCLMLNSSNPVPSVVVTNGKSQGCPNVHSVSLNSSNCSCGIIRVDVDSDGEHVDTQCSTHGQHVNGKLRSTKQRLEGDELYCSSIESQYSDIKNTHPDQTQESPTPEVSQPESCVIAMTTPPPSTVPAPSTGTGKRPDTCVGLAKALSSSVRASFTSCASGGGSAHTTSVQEVATLTNLPHTLPSTNYIPGIERGGSSCSNSQDMCRICHCGSEDTDSPLLAPCLCAGSLKFVHQACLQRWIKSSDTRYCELCKFEFMMKITTKPFLQWKQLEMSRVEKRKIVCSVTFHAIALTCVIWSLYVLIERTTEEINNGVLEWPFWTKLIVVAIGFTGGIVFMYVQCRMYLQLCRKWRSFNRTFLVQTVPPDVLERAQKAAKEKTLNQPVAHSRAVVAMVGTNAHVAVAPGDGNSVATMVISCEELGITPTPPLTDSEAGEGQEESLRSNLSTERSAASDAPFVHL